MIKRIFLDMDGVLTDFVGAALKLHGIDMKWRTDWPPGVRDIVKAINLDRKRRDEPEMTQDDFWGRINDTGADWWESIPAYEGAVDLYQALVKDAPVTILTSPSLDAGGASGKVRWLQNRFGTGFRDYVLTHMKQHCAGPGKVLIDDFEKQCNAFCDDGGMAVLYPRPWNANRAHARECRTYTVNMIHRIQDNMTGKGS